MTVNTLRQDTSKELRRLIGLLTASIGETLGSLVNRPITLRAVEPELTTAAAYVASLPRACAFARGALDKAFAGRTMSTLIEVPDALALAGLLLLMQEDVINQRRAEGVLAAEDADAIKELGNVLYSGIGNVLRDRVGNADVRHQDHGVVEPDGDPAALGAGDLVVCGFRLKVGEYPETHGAITLDPATAEAWNKGPLEVALEPAAAVAGAAGPGAPRGEDDGLDSIPEAPLRGTLAAFVQHGDAFQIVKLACRRVGLDLRRHGRGEIPNPAAHKNEVVLLDVMPGEERRFDWCRRIKVMSDSTRVVVLLHHPSRQRVTQAFLSRADAILGFPCEEQHLSQKLTSLLAESRLC
jgi:hypothetical protein